VTWSTSCRPGEQLLDIAVESEQYPIRSRRKSGSRSDGHLEGDRLGVAVVLARVALQGTRDRVQALALGVLAGRRAAAVDVQSRHTVVPGARLVIEEELGSNVALM
jgi:hypothetical protein